MQVAQLIRDYITVLAKERGLDRRRKSVGFDPSTKGSSDLQPGNVGPNPGGISSSLLNKPSAHPPLPPPRPSLSARQQHLIALTKVQQQSQIVQDQMYGNVYGTRSQPSPSPSMMSNQSMSMMGNQPTGPGGNNVHHPINQSMSNSSLYGVNSQSIQQQSTYGVYGGHHPQQQVMSHPMRQVQIVRPSPQSPAVISQFSGGQSNGQPGPSQQPFQRTHRRGGAVSVQYRGAPGPNVRMTDPEQV